MNYLYVKQTLSTFALQVGAPDLPAGRTSGANPLRRH